MSGSRPILIFVYLVIFSLAAGTADREQSLLDHDPLPIEVLKEPQPNLKEDFKVVAAQNIDAEETQEEPQPKVEEELGGSLPAIVATAPKPSSELELVHRILERVPLIDG